MKKKVAIIGSVGVPAKYGGFETLAEGLVFCIDKKYDLTIYCSSKSYKKKIAKFNNSKVKYIPLKANGWQSIPYDIWSMLTAVQKNDVILILGISGAVIFPILRFFSKAKIIVNIDGQEWTRAKWGYATRWFLKLSEQLAVKYAHSVVADNRNIQKTIKKLYGKDSFFIAYAGDHASKINLTKKSFKRYSFLNKPFAFAVCRIVPENMIHLILKAFCKLSELNLVFVGNWKASKFGIDLKEKFGNTSNVYLLDPIYNQTKLNELRSNCKIYINGHSSGGTPPSLVEAMWIGLPIVIFDTDCNRAATENKAIYYSSSESLINCLTKLNEELLTKISQNMKKIAKENYTWDIIGKKYTEIL